MGEIKRFWLNETLTFYVPRQSVWTHVPVEYQAVTFDQDLREGEGLAWQGATWEGLTPFAPPLHPLRLMDGRSGRWICVDEED